LTPVVITTAAKAEISRVAGWYEAQGEGLGVKFTDRVLETIDRIAVNPAGYRKVVGEGCRAILHKFPDALWFRLNEDVVRLRKTFAGSQIDIDYSVRYQETLS
jgi:plasmid stabilization system protein ParE